MTKAEQENIVLGIEFLVAGSRYIETGKDGLVMGDKAMANRLISLINTFVRVFTGRLNIVKQDDINQMIESLFGPDKGTPAEVAMMVRSIRTEQQTRFISMLSRMIAGQDLVVRTITDKQKYMNIAELEDMLYHYDEETLTRVRKYLHRVSKEFIKKQSKDGILHTTERA